MSVGQSTRQFEQLSRVCHPVGRVSMSVHNSSQPVEQPCLSLKSFQPHVYVRMRMLCGVLTCTVAVQCSLMQNIDAAYWGDALCFILSNSHVYEEVAGGEGHLFLSSSCWLSRSAGWF